MSPVIILVRLFLSRNFQTRGIMTNGATNVDAHIIFPSISIRLSIKLSGSPADSYFFPVFSAHILLRDPCLGMSVQHIQRQ